jgi:hypothetical protein
MALEVLFDALDAAVSPSALREHAQGAGISQCIGSTMLFVFARLSRNSNCWQHGVLPSIVARRHIRDERQSMKPGQTNRVEASLGQS